MTKEITDTDKLDIIIKLLSNGSNEALYVFGGLAAGFLFNWFIMKAQHENEKEKDHSRLKEKYIAEPIFKYLDHFEKIISVCYTIMQQDERGVSHIEQTKLTKDMRDKTNTERANALCNMLQFYNEDDDMYTLLDKLPSRLNEIFNHKDKGERKKINLKFLSDIAKIKSAILEKL